MFKLNLDFFHGLRAKDTRAIYYTLVFSTDFLVGLVATVYSLYLIQHGMDLFHVNLVNAVFMFSSVLFEIPTGAYADYAGRKKSVLLSFACLPVGFGIYFFSSTIGWFIFAELWTAFSIACLSGALDAWMVDRLHYQGYSSKTDLVFSHGGMASGLALLLGGFIGAQLANMQLGLPFGIGALLALLTFVFARWGMIESKTIAKYSEFYLRNGIKRMSIVLQQSVKYGIKHSVVIWLLLAAIVANLAFQPLNMYWAPRITELTHQQIWLLGYVWAGVSISLMVGAYLAKRLIKLTLPYRWLFIITTSFLALPIISIAFTSVVSTLVGGFLIYEIGRGLLAPLHKSYLNEYIPSSERATLLSFDSLMSKFGAGIGLVTFGWLAKHYSIELTWFIAGLILLLLILLYGYATAKNKTIKFTKTV